MIGDNRPYSEIWTIAADDWVEKDAVARLREDTKSLRFARHCQAHGDVPVNRAEQIVKASSYWYDEVVEDVNARTAANKAQVRMKSIEMQRWEHMNAEANNRAGARL